MLTESLQSLLIEAVEAAQAGGALPTFAIPDIEVAHPKQEAHGDYSSNVALVAASAIRSESGEKSNPRQLAQSIVDHLPPSDLIGAVELAGPGFINIRLADHWLQQQVLAILDAGDRFRLSRNRRGSTLAGRVCERQSDRSDTLRRRSQRRVGRCTGERPRRCRL